MNKEQKESTRWSLGFILITIVLITPFLLQNKFIEPIILITIGSLMFFLYFSFFINELTSELSKNSKLWKIFLKYIIIVIMYYLFGLIISSSILFGRPDVSQINFVAVGMLLIFLARMLKRTTEITKITKTLFLFIKDIILELLLIACIYLYATDGFGKQTTSPQLLLGYSGGFVILEIIISYIILSKKEQVTYIIKLINSSYQGFKKLVKEFFY